MERPCACRIHLRSNIYFVRKLLDVHLYDVRQHQLIGREQCRENFRRSTYQTNSYVSYSRELIILAVNHFRERLRTVLRIALPFQIGRRSLVNFEAKP